jgi:1-acyl-sn-glycerol-3-phosphate acyltransferase
MLYELLKLIVRLALRVFYKSFKVHNRHLIPAKGPLIIVANHPNTFMDPLIVASVVRPQVYFMAMGSLFTTPFLRWFFRQLHMLPIQRKHDTNKQKFDNKEIFQKCYDHLGKGGSLVIFPEGTSIRARRLQEVKTGTARIALGAEAGTEFKAGVRIVTLGINYSKHESFHSEVFIRVDEPIEVKEYADQYQTNPEEAVRALTERIRQQLEEHLIITDNDEQDAFAKQIETIYKRQLSAQIQLSDNAKEQDYFITKGIVDAIQHFEETDPARVQDFKPKITAYLRNLNRLDLGDEVFSKDKRDKHIFWDSFSTALYFIAGFPVFLYGVINNHIPYIIPSKVAAQIVKFTKADEYTAPVMMITGIFSFGVCYSLQLWVFQWYFGNAWLTLAYFISLPITGFFALFYAYRRDHVIDRWQLFTLFYKRAPLIGYLVQQRTEIIEALEQAKKDYLAHYEGNQAV